MSRALAALLVVAAVPAAQAAGPNAFGYRSTVVAADFVDPPSGLAPLGGLDDELVVVALPWAFPYYGVDYSQVFVSDNGGVRFGAGSVDFQADCLPPVARDSSPHVSVYWGDFETNGADIFAWHDAARDAFVVSWQDLAVWGTGVGDGGTFQVQLLPSGALRMFWRDTHFADSFWDDAANSTVGIVDVEPADADALQESCHTAWALEGAGLEFAFCDDLDGDGYTDSACGGDDCNDTDSATWPGALEICGDGLDQDCDGIDQLTDQDGDGYDSDRCVGGEDCDDSDAAVNPSVDADGDGFNMCVDCNDNYDIIFPGNPEICGDYIDQDCSGQDDPADEDGDGYDSPTCGGEDCDDADASIHPGIDADGDGFHMCEDCDDSDPAVRPDAFELCDGQDRDCSGEVDDIDRDGDGASPLACGGEDCDDGDANVVPGVDADGDGFDLCADCDDSDDTIYPGAAEACDGVDTDCDGLVDGQDSDTSGAGSGLVEEQTQQSEALPDLVDLQSTLAVTGGEIASITVSVDISHTYITDLTITLVSPAGTSVVLFDQQGSGGADMSATLFDDAAATAIEDGVEPFAGSFRPVEPLAVLIGEDLDGDWTLHVVDNSGGDSGTLQSWGISATTNEWDLDGDGWVDDCGDCDAADAAFNPGAAEICDDGVDQDCDGSDTDGDQDGDGFVDVDCGGEDCDDGDADVRPDIDGDGDGASVCDDCDDGDAGRYPAAMELCADAIDQDCDGEDLAFDGDGDGFGSLGCGGDDCDDSDAAIRPGVDIDGDGYDACDDCNDLISWVHEGANEICDQEDSDCDGTIPVDEVDADGDGFAECESDCDDTEPAMSPSGVEVCDGLDNDCDGVVPVDEADNDGDGYRRCAGDCDDDDPALHPGLDADADGSNACEDCDDGDASVAPGADEICDDGVDQDCSGEDLLGDTDGDGEDSPECGGDDCDPADSATWPGAPEACDGIDRDCDGLTTTTDADGDGAFDAACGGGDCDDGNINVLPGAEELCDGRDGDCDGVVPDDELDGDGDLSAPCAGDCDDDDPELYPGAVELCDEIDNNCNGLVDDSIVLDADSDGHDKEACGGDDCDDSKASVNPEQREDCIDGVDNDCDTEVDVDDEDCSALRRGCDASGGARPGGWAWALLGLVMVRRLRRRSALGVAAPGGET